MLALFLQKFSVTQILPGLGVTFPSNSSIIFLNSIAAFDEHHDILDSLDSYDLISLLSDSISDMV